MPIPSYKKLTFPGNDKLRNAGVEIDTSVEEATEYARCKMSFDYFCSNYMWIFSTDNGLIKFVMRNYQKEIYQLLEDNRFVIAKIPRQYGKTSTVVAYLLWKILFENHTRVGIFADKAATAVKILAMLQLAYEELPMWMQKGVIEWGKGKIKLENGSLIDCGATTGNSGRSGAYNFILLDEFAFVQKNLQEEFYRAVYPVITSGKTTKLFIISTPNGMDLFHKIWTYALQGRNQFKTKEIHWSALPGRDAKWRDGVISDIGQDAFDQEYGCEFLGSGGNTLISMTKLKNIPFGEPVEKIGRDNCFDIYIPPQAGRAYCLCADTSQGVGQDYSTFSIMDITSLPYIQVAKFRNNKISQTQFPMEIFRAGTMYNNAFVLIEINDGRQVGELLYSELEYEGQLFTYRKYQGTGQKISLDYGQGCNPGIIMSHTVKKTGMAHLKNLVEGDQLILTDHDTISELTTFIRDGGTYKAEAGKHDDMVMSLVVFSWLAIQPFFREITDSTIRDSIRAEREALNEGSIDHGGFAVDGINDPEGDSEVDGDGLLWTVAGGRNPYNIH